MADITLPPVPTPYSEDPRHLLDWALRLTAWINLVDQSDYQLEETLALGGIDMASRLYGVEHIWQPLQETYELCVSAPAAGKKKIITWTHTATNSSVANNVGLVKVVGGVSHLIGRAQVVKNAGFSENGPTQIVLDGEDESMGIICELEDLTDDYFFEATYLDVD